MINNWFYTMILFVALIPINGYNFPFTKQDKRNAIIILIGGTIIILFDVYKEVQCLW